MPPISDDSPSALIGGILVRGFWPLILGSAVGSVLQYSYSYSLSLLPLFPCADTTASAGASANTGEMLCHRNFDSPVTEPQRPLLQKQAEGGGTKLKLQAPTTRGVPKQAHLSNSSRMARVADATAQLPKQNCTPRRSAASQN